MKALSIRQPFASAILAGLKGVEYRTWSTAHRGWLLVHAAARKAAAADLECFPSLAASTLPCGALVGVVRIIEVEAIEDIDDPSQIEEYHWHLADAQAFRQPIPCKGRLGLWDLPADLMPAVASALASLGLSHLLEIEAKGQQERGAVQEPLAR